MNTDKSYEGLRDRDYFHIMLNLDSHEGFLPTARSLAEGYLDVARKLQEQPDIEPQLRPFPYSKSAFEARLDEVYQGFADDVSRYEATKAWTQRARADVVEQILQMAPFNQTDGAWLRSIAPVGPIDAVRSLLFTIYVDELGGGNPELNHPNIYTDLLVSVGFELPDIRSREYADNPALLDSAFTLPVFQLVVSQFPQDYFPELLGMTQYLEWSSVELKNMVLLNESFGLDPHFYEMHVAIDNASTGHGAMARRAVELYLEGVRVDAGEDAMQEQWARIWNGYIAFATTGNLANDIAARLRRRPPSAAEQVAAIVLDRAPRARLNHGQKRLGGVLLNDLFADPAKLMKALVTSGMVVPGKPESSPFFDLVTADGPMYRVFTDVELATFRQWVLTLTAEPPAVPATPAAAGPAEVADRMALLVETMRARQDGTPAHAGTELTGPDPGHPTRRLAKPVAWWFQQPARALMQALADKDSGWVTPGDAAASPFVTDLLRGRNAMSRALAGTAPDGSTWADTATEWINAGCPLPSADLPVRPLTLLSPPERVTAHPTGNIHGSGSVH